MAVSALDLLIFFPASLVSACAVCFTGDSNDQFVTAFYIGGGILLASVFSILVTLVLYIRRSERRKAELFARMGLMSEGEASQERWPL